MLPDERSIRTSWLGELPAVAVTGLRRLGIASASWMGNKVLRCRESVIVPNESIYVLGAALEHHGMSHHIANESRLYIGHSRDQTFIISDRSEKDLVSKLTWQMWACFLGGLIVVAACTALLLNRYVSVIEPS